MRNIKLTIEYDGSHFRGWQIQPRNQRTVQGELIKACKKVFGHPIKLIGSGRTDAGVHALGQVANFHTRSMIPINAIPKALNANLPKDISIIEAKEVSKDFHAQYSAKMKTYRYTIFTKSIRSALEKGYALHYPYKLNLPIMRKEAACLCGKKNFKSFQSVDPSKKREDTVRTIKRIEIRKKNANIIIKVEADGFLYKMVRNIVGTLLAIGSGRMQKGSINIILTEKNRNSAGPAVKPHGLCLLKVNY